MMKADAFNSLHEGKSLVVDGSGTSVFVGLLGTDGQWIARHSEINSPLEGLFSCVEAVLQSAQTRISDVRNFIYCEGPGSVLGLRLCAMAIQTWGHLCESTIDYIAYNSLELTAALIIKDNPDIIHALLVSDWKKGVWNSVEIKDGQLGATTAISEQSAKSRENATLFYLSQRKGWKTVPPQAHELSYSPQRLPEALHLLKKTKTIELYSSNMNVFKKWVPQRHRAQT